MLGIESRYDLGEGTKAVQRVNLKWYTELGVILKDLSLLDDGSADPSFQLFLARMELDTLADSLKSHLQLRASQPLLRHLIDSIKSFRNLKDDDKAERSHGTMIIGWYAKQLLPVLNGELAVQNCYLVSPKRAYDIEILTEDALKLFSEKVRGSLVAVEKYDIRQAGRCLAFEIPTAALFHMFRAADSVLRRWYEAVTGTVPKPQARNWGTYIKNLRKIGADEKILSALEHIKDLHRNPVIHPEAQVSVDEALSFVGIAESIISSMITDLGSRETTQSLFGALPSVSTPPTRLGAAQDLLGPPA